MLKTMIKMLKMLMQRKFTFWLLAINMFFAVLISVLSILARSSLQTDYTMFDMPFSILIVLSMSQNQFDQGELILCGISRRQLVFSRYIGRFAVLLFCFFCAFSGYIFAETETKLILLSLFLLMLIRECLCIPLVLSMNRAQTRWNMVGDVDNRCDICGMLDVPKNSINATKPAIFHPVNPNDAADSARGSFGGFRASFHDTLSTNVRKKGHLTKKTKYTAKNCLN